MTQTLPQCLWSWLAGVFSTQTIELMKVDLRRFRLRRRRWGESNLEPPKDRLHLGCGQVHVDGWLNVDLYNSDYDLDLAGGRLPWGNGVFEVAVSQHMIEHLELELELLPLLKEVRRVLKHDGEIWLSCPDIEKICHSYVDHGMTDLLRDRKSRWPDFPFGDMPAVHLINHLFCQEGGHKNLFDLDLLSWTLGQAGFQDVERVVEADLLRRFPEFPVRNDDRQTLYVCARKAA